MCLIIHQPAGVQLTASLLSDIHRSNPDGFGAMYAENGRVHVLHCMDDEADICATYADHLSQRACVIHFRRQTHGRISLDNCHPYRVTNDIWLAHNGVLACSNPVVPAKSDTWHFIRYVLQPALLTAPGLLLDKGFRSCLGNLIGRGNKLALMRADGEVVIINRGSGFEHAGIWFSNDYSFDLERLEELGGVEACLQ